MANEAIGSRKIVFADQLRGIAALLVVINHYTGVYWYARDLIAQSIFAPVQTAAVPAVAQAVIGIPFNPGPLGVALFFMISGFVIPFSFRHHSAGSFLVARVLRIYPTYLAALMVGLAARFVSALYWGHGFVVSPKVFLGNALLIQDLLNVPSVDLVNWTLTIELKFYLLFALCYPVILRWKGWFVLAAGIGAIALNGLAVALLPHLPVHYQGVAVALGNEAMCIGFMMLGTLFFLYLRDLLSVGSLLAGSAAGLALFVLCWRIGTMGEQFPVVMVNYLYGWVAFAGCFFLRQWFIPLAPLRFLAAISYPLYLVHPMVGWVLLTLLTMGFGVGYVWAAAGALGAAVLLAGVIHVVLERRCIAWGRAIGRGAVMAAPTGVPGGLRRPL